MTARMISGRDVAAEIKENLRHRVAALTSKGVAPGLAAILIGERSESVVYVGLKEKDCASVGVRSLIFRLPESATQTELEETISRCNRDPEIHGILLQHPIPPHLNEDAALQALDTHKDVDGVTNGSMGALAAAAPALVSPTALGAMALIRSTGVPLQGKRAVVVGRSRIIGLPVALLLLQENATVTICHSRTVSLPEVTRDAEILVAAINQPEYFRKEHIKPGAIVIDCGYNRLPDRRGDVGAVDYAAASEVAGWISPVPGGVGPAGRAMLIANCVRAAEIAAG